MKNTFKLFGVIVLVAVIGFSMAACGDDDEETVAVTGVTVSPTTLSLTLGSNATGTLTATVSPDNATNKNVSWSSSDTSKATVSNGTVTAVAAGTATITVTTEDGDKTAACTVTVTGGSSGGSVTPSTFTLTGIPSQHNGKYARLSVASSSGGGLMLYGCENMDVNTQAWTLSIISNGSVSLPMWKVTSLNPPALERYYGNDTINNETFGVGIHNSATLTASNIDSAIDNRHFTPVTFSNGGASRTWSQGTTWQD